ncbi:putative alpha beta hydrolase fold-containing protein [Erysiphe neolycopersici]|uniref:Putative alpha beta hydrolase fold-containing protein n=1 Tax=Erysiphe neolycopersici TaxID=212602 RepID=A0A420HCY5_9PEZI|nr:putative alpha beta hydrolase fold-containing protein [Erysiphe neolycopersici]
MDPSVSMSARNYASATSRRNSAADYHTANTLSQIHLEPASSEVISNLIISLSVMPKLSHQESHQSTRPSSTSAQIGTDSFPFRNSNVRVETCSETCSGSSQSLRKDFEKYQHSASLQSSLDQDIGKLTSSSLEAREASQHLLFKLTRSDTSTCSNSKDSPLNVDSRTVLNHSDVVERRSIGNLSIKPAQMRCELLGKPPDARTKRQRRIIYKSSLEKLRNKELEKQKKSRDSINNWPCNEPMPTINGKITFCDPKFNSNNLEEKVMGSSILASENINQDESKSMKGLKKLVTKDSLSLKSESDGGFPANPSGTSTDPSIESRTTVRAYQQDKDPESRKNIHSKESGIKTSERPYSKQKNQSSLSPGSPRTTGNFKQSHTDRVSIDERSSSIGSIDEAVEAYLCAPRLSQKIRNPQTGRVISFSEVGDPEGFAVFCCVGMGLTRYVTAFYDELALSLKLRLITPDRPGVGDSEPYNDGTSTPLSWPDDVYTICQFLRITKFSILAHSAGAIYALATALRMPQHIRGRIHLLAPWIPPSQMSVIGGRVGLPPNSSIPTSQRILRVLPTTILKAANSSFISATSNSLTSSLSKQRKSKRKSIGREIIAASARNTLSTGIENEILRRNSPLFLESSNLTISQNEDAQINSEANILAAAAYSLAVKERQVNYESRLTHAIWNLATQGANPAVDLLVCLERRHTIGFRYVDITRAVVIHHGSKDTRVPLENVLWMGKTMKRCDVHVLEGEGHSLMASASVMSGILTEIAKEWEDWMRVTTSTVAHRNEGIRRALIDRASIGAFR